MKRFHSLWRNFGLAALVLVAAMLPVLAGCEEGDPKTKAEDAASGTSGVTFAVYDHNFAPLSGASVYLDSGTSPVAMTDASGLVTLSLSGIHDVHIHMSGHGGRSYIHRDWSAVTTQQTVRLPRNVSTGTTGNVSGNISPTTPGDPPYRVRAVRLEDGLNPQSGSITPAADTTPYAEMALQGNNEFFLYPNAANASASLAYAAYSPTMFVAGGGTVNVNFTPSVGGGITFSMSGTNGLSTGVGGQMSSSYLVSRDPFSISRLFSNSTNVQATTALSNDMLTVPPIHTVYPGANYQLLVTSRVSGINAVAERAWMEIYRSYAELSAAPLSPSYTLPNFGVSIMTPGDGSTNAGSMPTFTWNMTGSPQFMEIVVNRHVAGFTPTPYVEIVWQAWIYGQTFANYPPVLNPLLPDAGYMYSLQGRSNHLDGSGVYRGFERDGFQNIRFGTGPTSPP